MATKYTVSDKKQQKKLIFCISLGAFMGTLDIGIVNIALPMISRDFNISISLASKITLIYLIVTASFIPMFGKLADNKGYKKLFISGSALFFIGSLLCAIAPGIYTLIASRALQALGSAITMPISFALISLYFPKKKRDELFGKLSMWISLAFILGPVAGGLITHYLGWRMIFFINVPLGIIRKFLALGAIPADTPAVSKSPLGMRDCFLAFLFFLCLILMRDAFKADWPHYQAITFGLGITALFSFIAFILLQKKSSDPLINPKLFKIRAFTLGNMVSFFSVLIYSGLAFVIPFFLMEGRGYSTHAAGLLWAVAGLATFMVSPVAGWLAERYNLQKMQIMAILLMGCAICVYLTFNTQNTIAIFIAGTAIFGTGLGMLKPPNSAIVMNSPPADLKGEASSVFSMLNKSGYILGIFLFEIIFTLYLPLSAQKQSHSLHHLNLPEHAFDVSWRHVIYIAIILCAVCMIPAVMNLSRRGASEKRR